MGKKKQPDFQPVKLRVGKHLPKGKNITNTAFKSKKIITRDQNFKTAQKDIPLSELLRLLKHNNVPIKLDALKRIKNYIGNNMCTLALYFSDIVNELGRILLQDNIKVRKEAVDLFIYCLDSLSETQMFCFMNSLVSYLDCMMTHVNNSVRKESLHFLYGILKTHPTLICCYTKILFNLLNMISCQNYQQKETKGQVKRKLIDTINEDMTSVELRDRVLKLAVEFLEKLIENFTKKEINEDEQKIYWDGNQPLYVSLYSGSGLTPAKKEFYCIGQVKSESKISTDLRSFLEELVPLSSKIITEEVASTIVSSNCNILRVDNVRRLNTITQLLCQLAEWFMLNSDIKNNEDTEFLSLINSIVCKKLMLRFPYTQQCYPTKKTGKSTEEVHLNLGICYLYNAFILGTCYCKKEMEKRVVQYLCLSYTVTNFTDIKSVSLTLKNIKKFIEFSVTKKGEAIRTTYGTEISNILCGLCGNIAKFKNTATAKLTEAFFIKISLDYEYKFLLCYEGMDQWIKYLFRELKQMLLTKTADKMLLKCINQICSREYPVFLENLSTLASPVILEYLKFDDEDYQFTIMNLITHMKNLPGDFLQDVAEFILSDTTLSSKTAVRFIRLLYHRFSETSIQDLEFLTFLKFLINVAFDIVSIYNQLEDTNTKSQNIHEDMTGFEEMDTSDFQNQEENGVTNELPKLDLHKIKSLLTNVQCICVNTIMPSVLWERHADIFEECVECLFLCSRIELVCQCTRAFVQYLMQIRNLQLQVHSVVAFFKLTDRLSQHEGGYIYTEEIMLFSNELMVSSLLYLSLMTNKVPINLLKPYGIGGLQESLNLNREFALRVFNILSNKVYDQGLDELKCLYVLRIVKFFISKKLTSPEDVFRFIQVLRAIEESYCPEDSPQRAVLNEIYVFLDIIPRRIEKLSV